LSAPRRTITSGEVVLIDAVGPHSMMRHLEGHRHAVAVWSKPGCQRL
jgi:hypothetical protein